MEAEIAAAEAWEAGAEGVVEEDEGRELIVYLPSDCTERLVHALNAAPCSLQIGSPEAVPEVVWSEAWKEVLVPVEISPRLVVAPSFAPRAPGPGQRWIAIEPGQAFGTGAHHSTRLALEGIDAVLLRGAARSVLDVGTGSGVLALAALALGAERAIGLDLDPLAAPAARRAARDNGLAERAAWLTGPIDALRGAPRAGPVPGRERRVAGRFDLVVANLLRAELLPIAERVADRVAANGHLVLAGLLERDESAVRDAMARAGLRIASRRTREDDDGASWLGLLLVRA
jgi:ribosomal protein L11 methyltransferase